MVCLVSALVYEKIVEIYSGLFIGIIGAVGTSQIELMKILLLLYLELLVSLAREGNYNRCHAIGSLSDQ